MRRDLFDKFIVILLFGILPIDMLNGIMLKAGITLPLSISQVFKFTIIIFLFIRMSLFPKFEFLLLIFVFILLCIPSVIQQFSFNYREFFLVDDLIKTSKYITPFLSLIFFKSVFENNSTKGLLKLIYYWIFFSYVLFAVNILLKYVGLGFPMYEYANTGTKGFFYSGNEISALLLVLYSFIAYHFWEIKKNKLWFFLFFIFNLIVAITITSKTAMIGIVLITLMIPLRMKEFVYVSFNKIISIFIIIFFIIPVAVYLAYRLLADSLIMERLTYFYNKLDPVTFIFSGRNLKAKEMIEIYKKDYNILQELMGGGQTYYESQLGSVIEIDFLDLFFAYGIMGALIFIFIIFLLSFQSLSRTFNNNYQYAKLSVIMLFILTFTSSIAGHVYNSGIAGFYIGFVLSLMYLKRETL